MSPTPPAAADAPSPAAAGAGSRRAAAPLDSGGPSTSAAGSHGGSSLGRASPDGSGSAGSEKCEYEELARAFRTAVDDLMRGETPMSSHVRLVAQRLGFLPASPPGV